MTYTPDRINAMADNFEEIAVTSSGKRLGVQWCTWMGDWFTSWSPRNSNNNAEGPWDQWVDLAVRILQDPMTAIVRPELHEKAKDFEVKNFYTEADRDLSEQELIERFGKCAGR